MVALQMPKLPSEAAVGPTFTADSKISEDLEIQVQILNFKIQIQNYQIQNCPKLIFRTGLRGH